MSTKKLPELSNIDIKKIYAGNHLYRGCYPKDRLQHLTTGFYFINLNNHNQPGSHWDLIFNSPPYNPDLCIYFNPFGEIGSSNEEYQMKKTLHKVIHNTKDIQPLSSESCGWYCCYMASNLCQGRSFPSIMKDFTTGNTEKNEAVLKRYFKK